MKVKSFYLNVTLKEKWCNSILWCDNVRGTFGCLSFFYEIPRYITDNYKNESQMKLNRKMLVIKKVL